MHADLEAKFGNLESPVRSAKMDSRKARDHLFEYGSLILRAFHSDHLKIMCPDVPLGRPKDYEEYILRNFSRLNSYGISYDLDVTPTTHRLLSGVPSFPRATASSKDTTEVLRLSSRRIRRISIPRANLQERLERSEKFVVLLENLLCYGKDTLENSEHPLLWDIAHKQQFVYGKLHSDAPRDYILVDVDPIMSRKADDARVFFSTLAHWARSAKKTPSPIAHGMDASLLQRLSEVARLADEEHEKYESAVNRGVARV